MIRRPALTISQMCASIMNRLTIVTATLLLVVILAQSLLILLLLILPFQRLNWARSEEKPPEKISAAHRVLFNAELLEGALLFLVS